MVAVCPKKLFGYVFQIWVQKLVFTQASIWWPLSFPSFWLTVLADFHMDDGCDLCFKHSKKCRFLHRSNSICSSLNQILDFSVSSVLLHTIHELANSSSKSLNMFKTQLLCRNHDALQIHFELIFWMNCVKFSSPYDSRDANFGLRRFKFIQETNCRDTTGKEKWYMQKNLKNEQHVHSDPQMRSR